MPLDGRKRCSEWRYQRKECFLPTDEEPRCDDVRFQTRATELQQEASDGPKFGMLQATGPATMNDADSQNAAGHARKYRPYHFLVTKASTISLALKCRMSTATPETRQRRMRSRVGQRVRRSQRAVRPSGTGGGQFRC